MLQEKFLRAIDWFIAPQARTDAATHEMSTTSHSARLMGRRTGCSVKVCQLTEELEAAIDLFA